MKEKNDGLIKNKIKDKIKRLKEYTKVSSDEYSFVCSFLIRVYDYSDYISNQLKKNIEKEIEKKLKWYEENTKIVEKPVLEEYTEKVLYIKGLDY